jgi:hypothetical protein
LGELRSRRRKKLGQGHFRQGRGDGMTWQEDLRKLRVAQENVRILSRENRDLRIHLRDRDAHIRNLEAMLRPHLVGADDDGIQETLA